MSIESRLQSEEAKSAASKSIEELTELLVLNGDEYIPVYTSSVGTVKSKASVLTGKSPEYNLTFSGNLLKLFKDNIEVNSFNLSLYLDDTNLARIVSGVIDGNTKIVTFTRDDNTTFTIDFSSLLPSLDLELTVLKGVADDLSNIKIFADPSGATYPNGYYFVESVGGNQYFVVKNNQTDHDYLFANTQFGFGGGGTGWAKFSFLNDAGVELQDVFPSVPSNAEANGYIAYDVSNYNFDFTGLTLNKQYPFKFTRLREATQWASTSIKRDNITQESSGLNPNFLMSMNVSGFTQVSDDVGRDFSVILDPPDSTKLSSITNFASFKITSTDPRTITFQKSTSAPLVDKLINPETGLEEDQIAFDDLKGSGMFVVNLIGKITNGIYIRKYFINKIGFATTTSISQSEDGNETPISRLNSIEDVEPTSTEVPTPVSGDTASLYLTSGKMEKWLFTSSWTKSFVIEFNGINSVLPSENINIDNSDPINPVISTIEDSGVFTPEIIDPSGVVTFNIQTNISEGFYEKISPNLYFVSIVIVNAVKSTGISNNALLIKGFPYILTGGAVTLSRGSGWNILSDESNVVRPYFSGDKISFSNVVNDNVITVDDVLLSASNILQLSFIGRKIN